MHNNSKIARVVIYIGLILWLLVMPGWWKLLAGGLFLFSYSFFYDWLNLVLSPETGEE